jgi:rubrerythrin
MEPTSTGHNRTGAAMKPEDIGLMLKAVEELSPPVAINTLRIDVERQTYITDADNVGSIPPSQQPGKRGRQKGAAEPTPAGTAIFLDKLGERLAFERTGTRLYTALISKHLALLNAGDDVLPPLGEDENAAETLQRIRSEELAHFHLLSDCITQLGGDPTAQTPCADVTAAASMGLLQVITDPRTTLAQSLNAILTAELTDNAGWELLIKLAEDANQPDLVEQFSQALQAEEQHLVIVKGWIESLLKTEAGTPAV